MNEQPHNEEAGLLLRAAEGDGVAFGILYRRHLPIVLRWCWSQTGDRELAADLSSEVFAAALRNSRSYRPEQGPPIAWLLGIARNKLLESRRSGRVESRARRRLGIPSIELTDDDLARVEELSSLDDGAVALVQQLPAEQRQAILGRIGAAHHAHRCRSSRTAPMRSWPSSFAARRRSSASGSAVD